MKKIFEQHSKYEQVFRNKDFSELVEEVKSFKNISNHYIDTIKVICYKRI